MRAGKELSVIEQGIYQLWYRECAGSVVHSYDWDRELELVGLRNEIQIILLLEYGLKNVLTEERCSGETKLGIRLLWAGN